MTSKEGQLKPCPFCGAEAEMFKIYGDETYSVRCCNDDSCGANIEAFTTAEMALTAWNRRMSEVEDASM